MADCIKVLILEERQADAELAVQQLREADFEPDWQRVDNESDYLSRLDQEFDLILADYKLPRFDGLKALRLLHSRDLDTPFVMVTGDLGDELAVECMKRGASDYVLKSELVRLGPVVKNIIMHKRMREERQLAVEELAFAQDYARRLVDCSLNMIVSVDEDRNIMEFNPAAEAAFGYRKAEVVGKSVDMLYANPRDGLQINDVIMNGGQYTCDIVNKRRNGETFPSVLAASLLQDANGCSVGVMGISQDITDRKRAQEALTQRLEEVQALNQELEQAKRLTRYFSPDVANSILAGNIDVDPASKRKKLTTFFSDIRGFTTLSEELEPEELVDLLNEYLSVMTEIVFRHGGTVDKYIGDAIMAVFGDPIPQEDHAAQAMSTALEMQATMAEMQAGWFDRYRETLAIGIGITTGYATVGNIGSASRMEYTALGTQVNLASRLASKAKPGQILVSERTVLEGRDLVEATAVEQIELDGISRPVRIYEITGKTLVQSEDPGRDSARIPLAAA